MVVVVVGEGPADEEDAEGAVGGGDGVGEGDLGAGRQHVVAGVEADDAGQDVVDELRVVEVQADLVGADEILHVVASVVAGVRVDGVL